MAIFGLVVLGAHTGAHIKTEILKCENKKVLLVEPVPDNLEGLKENVIVGRLVPAGTGLTKMGWDKEAQKEDELRLEELKKEEQESTPAAE